MAYSHAQSDTSIPQSHLDGFGTIFVVIFCVFMLLAVIGQLFYMNWRTWLTGAEGTGSMLDSVKSAVYTVISQLS